MNRQWHSITEPWERRPTIFYFGTLREAARMYAEDQAFTGETPHLLAVPDYGAGSQSGQEPQPQQENNLPPRPISP